jgi:protein gp37
MADGTHISWTDATWNPITGCRIKSPGCQHCYAMTLAGTRLRHHPSRAGLTISTKAGPVWNGKVTFNAGWLDQPTRWKTPRDIFVVAHGDLFYQEVPFEWIDRVFGVITSARHHRYQILTKRPEIAALYLRTRYGAGIHHPHVLIGTSVELQKEANERRPFMAEIAARGFNTWVSYEPALGPVDWSGWEFIRWMVSGGESGRRARPTHPDWHRAARDFCTGHSIPFHFKQWGEWVSILDRDNDDPDWRCDYAKWGRSPRHQFLNLAGGIGFHGERLLVMHRVGKKAASAVLDGREWRQMPGTETKGLE